MILFWIRFSFVAFQPLPESLRDQWLCIHLVHGWKKYGELKSGRLWEGMKGRPPQVLLEKAEKNWIHGGYDL